MGSIAEAEAPLKYGLAKTLYNRWKRWSDIGVFPRMQLELANLGRETAPLMINATQSHRTASSLGLKKGGGGRLIGRTKAA